ncbi:GTP 3',8-cyclase MoaA [Viridibacterium curvum]|uniref:GTP 3',8-cyclase n=1 Tax=Viridibacterium curvum TaxID=1101404 RepID=A0ABP9QVP2_9RHOO
MKAAPHTHAVPLSSLRRPSAVPDLPLVDTLRRPLQDLRISVTDRCNFRCAYCMPREQFGADHPFLPRQSLLSFEEITRVARIFADLGVTKIRLTGGEPLMRKDLYKLVAMLAQLPGIDLTLTTNGALLARHAQALKDAGLQRLTVSLDALDEATHARMSDSSVPLADVLKGIAAAEAAGFRQLKINMVVQRGVNDHAILDMLRHFRGSGHILRFIEFMDVGETNHWQMKDVLGAREILQRIASEYPIEPIEANYTGEVAKRWRLVDGSAEIGVIASVTQAFCRDCTRLRLSPEGKLFTCLFATQGHDLTTHLRTLNEDDSAVAAWIASVWAARKDRYSELRHAGQATGGKIEMSYIGG